MSRDKKLLNKIKRILKRQEDPLLKWNILLAQQDRSFLLEQLMLLIEHDK